MVWQRAIDMVPKVYEILKKFPQHLSIAKGSLAELEKMDQELKNIGKPLSGLMSSLRES